MDKMNRKIDQCNKVFEFIRKESHGNSRTEKYKIQMQQMYLICGCT